MKLRLQQSGLSGSTNSDHIIYHDLDLVPKRTFTSFVVHAVGTISRFDIHFDTWENQPGMMIGDVQDVNMYVRTWQYGY